MKNLILILILILILTAISCKKSDSSSTIAVNNYATLYGVIWHPAYGNQLQEDGEMIIENDTLIIYGITDTVFKFYYKPISGDSVLFVNNNLGDTNQRTPYQAMYNTSNSQISGNSCLHTFFYGDSLAIILNSNTIYQRYAYYYHD